MPFNIASFVKIFCLRKAKDVILYTKGFWFLETLRTPRGDKTLQHVAVKN
jgi:hypothetical protein